MTISIEKIVLVSLLLFGVTITKGQTIIPDSTQVGDTVIVKFGNNSNIVFHIKDQDDLATLKKYDLNALLRDLSLKMENAERKGQTLYIEGSDSYRYLKDSTLVAVIKKDSGLMERDSTVSDITVMDDGQSGDTVLSEEPDPTEKKRKKSYHTGSFEFGTNNYLSNGQFPDASNALYTVRPWGSWYVSIGSINTFAHSEHFHLELGASISWYNFKFQNNKTRLEKQDDGLDFFEDDRDFRFIKSKLTVPYINASFMPVFKFGDEDRKPLNDKNYSTGQWNIGIGTYAGYRIGGHTKAVFDDGDSKERDKARSNYFLNNFRYGLKLQLGYGGVDVFATYDLNELFVENRGPKLNAFAFGIRF